MCLDSGTSLTDFPPGFHEDDTLRSEFVRRLFVTERPLADPTSGSSSRIPKVLVMR